MSQESVTAWSPTQRQVAAAIDRLVAAGLRPEVAEVVAHHPRGGPVVLAPGVVISLFPLPTETGAA